MEGTLGQGLEEVRMVPRQVIETVGASALQPKGRILQTTIRGLGGASQISEAYTLDFMH